MIQITILGASIAIAHFELPKLSEIKDTKQLMLEWDYWNHAAYEPTELWSDLVTIIYICASLITSRKRMQCAQFAVLALLSAFGDPFSWVRINGLAGQLQEWRLDLKNGYSPDHGAALVAVSDWIWWFQLQSYVPLVVAWWGLMLMPAQESRVGSVRVQRG